MDLTGSAAWAGVLAGALMATAFLLRLPAGLVTDRVDRRRLMMWCDAGRCVALASIAVAYFAGTLEFAHLLLVAVVEGTRGVLFAPAEAAAVRRVVAPRQVGEAVARNQARSQLAGLLGPPVGGVLYVWSRGLPFVADALTYAVSLVTVAGLRTPLSEPVPPPRHRLRAELVEGLAWLWHDRFCAPSRCGLQQAAWRSPRWG